MRLIIFDMDGTLIDSEAFITQKMTQSFEAEGLDPPGLAASRQIIGLSLPEAMAKLSGLSGDRLALLVLRYRDLYHADVSDGGISEALYRGARGTITRLAKDDETLLGIATGKAMRGVERVLKLHDMSALFTTLQTPDHNPSKPHPGMLMRAMSETGIGAERCVMIGDTSFDMEMAKAAGVKALGVNWGYHEEAVMRRAGADLIIDDYAELIAAIDTLIGE